MDQQPVTSWKKIPGDCLIISKVPMLGILPYLEWFKVFTELNSNSTNAD